MKDNKRTDQRTGWKIGAAGFLAALTAVSPVSFAGEAAKAEKFEEVNITLYKEMFDQNAYSEGANQLDLSRWARKIFRKKVPSANVNIFDEVPDSTFFINRQGRQKLSSAELEKGFSETAGPDLSRPLTVIATEQRGLNYGFVVEDAKKDKYVLRFDPQNSLELNTGAEVVASRFYHAIGYNVPQYTILNVKADQLSVGPDAITCDNTGFVKKMTQDILDRYLSSMPQTSDGAYRASASKVPAGKEVGEFSFLSRRKSDPQDPVNHRDRREIRGLGIFTAWLNDTCLYENNTTDMMTTENGQTVFKHYLMDFTNALGASTDGPKPPTYGYEYMVDYGETFKTILALGLREKPWQKKWREAGEKADPLPAVGYFSNKDFDPAKFKTQLPYETFRMTTSADGFWAAKILMSFSDEDIRAMVKAGRYSDPKAEERIAQLLIERRDMIARHWFSKASPLDNFELTNGKLTFSDLAVDHGFEKKENAGYSVEVRKTGEKGKALACFNISETSFAIDPAWLSAGGELELVLRASRGASKKPLPAVKVSVGPKGIQGIRHED